MRKLPKIGGCWFLPTTDGRNKHPCAVRKAWQQVWRIMPCSHHCKRLLTTLLQQFGDALWQRLIRVSLYARAKP